MLRLGETIGARVRGWRAYELYILLVVVFELQRLGRMKALLPSFVHFPRVASSLKLVSRIYKPLDVSIALAQARTRLSHHPFR
jgi:hypothetical protein